MKYIALFFFIITSQLSLNAQNKPVVIELYTSQGCSSCPPADALLEDVHNTYGDDVIVLSYHVDYWNYIGWEDPFSSKEMTQRQYNFASSINSRNVYTPQAVINGKTHFTGSNKTKMEQSIAYYKNKDASGYVHIVSATKNERDVQIQLHTEGISDEATITAAVTVKNRTTAISRGENRSRTLTNTHIVAGVRDTNNGDYSKNISITIADWVKETDILEAVVYVKSTKKGIITATRTTIH